MHIFISVPFVILLYQAAFDQLGVFIAMKTTGLHYGHDLSVFVSRNGCEITGTCRFVFFVLECVQEHLFDISRALFIEKNICRDTLELLSAGDQIDPRFYVFSLQ